jgi:signal recognition particle receptor subunit beta
MDNLYLIIFTCVISLVILVALIYFFFLGKIKKAARGSKIYLLGPKSCGKTQFFIKMTSPTTVKVAQTSEPQKAISTVTSILKNEHVFDTNVTLVDTPGHKRLRPGVEELKEAKSFIIWIDENTLVSDAEYLLQLFNKSKKDEIPVAIISNLPKNKIQTGLEECIEQFNRTQLEHSYGEFNLDDYRILKSIDEIDDIKTF